MIWQPIDENEEIKQLIENIPPPSLGQHIGKTVTLFDGRWLVIQYTPTSHKPNYYTIIPAPPNIKTRIKTITCQKTV